MSGTVTPSQNSRENGSSLSDLEQWTSETVTVSESFVDEPFRTLADLLSNSTTRSHADLNVTSGIVIDNSSLGQARADLFDEKGVNITYSLIYSVIWLFCVGGNSVVLIVIKRSPSLHNRTNLFLCHLAVADLSVGLVCIIPNLVHAHLVYWFPGPMGHFFCKFYNFTDEFSLTVSVLLLVLIATERYVAILHPLKARRLFTRRRMYAALTLIWLSASVYNIPLLIIYVTVVTNTNTTYCYRAWYIIDLPLYTVMNSVLTFVFPLICMTGMYIRICLTLWRSSGDGGGQPNVQQRDTTTGSLTSSAGTKCSPDGDDVANNADSRDGSKTITDDNNDNRGTTSPTSVTGSGDGVNSTAGSAQLRVSSHRVLMTRRKVVRMLVVVLAAFAVTVFPHHMRAVCRYYKVPGRSFWVSGFGKYMMQILQFLNSALNPLLYSLLSDSFRRGVREVFCATERSADGS